MTTFSSAVSVAKSPLLIAIAIGFAAIATPSANAAEPVIHYNIEYAQRDGAAARATSLDLYVPPQAKQAPIVVWIHGGGWRHGDKRMVSAKPAYFCDRGMMLASINYRLTPAADVRGEATDVADAIRWLVDHAQEYDGDPRQIILLGHSAGAHLAALIATDHQYLEKAGVDLAAIRGVILLDGAGYNVERQIKESRLPALRNLYLNAFGDDPEDWQALSPLLNVEEKRTYPPVLILYVNSRRDSTAQSVALSERLQEVGGQAEAIGYDDKSHATINREFGVADDPPTEAASKFLDRVLGKATP
jgi:acetyl esterase/lipase